MMQLSQVSAAVNGRLFGSDAVLQGISINTRDDCAGRLFVALKGENFDAHEYLQQAQLAGAGAALIERDVETDLPKIVVQDTHQALQDLASWWRGQFVIPLIGVTGSVGKTTVKEMLGSIFALIGEGVVTKGNLNNEIGVPLTLMCLDEASRYAVVEMGMSQRGEISRISAIARPTIALINNAAAAHLEGLGTIQAVAQAKGEIFEGLTEDGVAVINLDDDFAPLWLGLAGTRKVLTFGLSSEADIWAKYKVANGNLKMTVHADGKTSKIELHALGEHSVSNALAAIAAARAANIPLKTIKAGLQAYRPLSGRLNLERHGAVTLIDDTYNANPLSMRAAIEVLAQYQNSTLIVGDMGELGQSAEQEHSKLGAVAAELGIDRLFACGEFAHLVGTGFGPHAKIFSNQQALIDCALECIDSGTVLIKGSRSAKMERVIAALRDKFQVANATRSGDH